MIISASIQAADQLNILQSIQQHSSEFDQIHVDITVVILQIIFLCHLVTSKK